MRKVLAALVLALLLSGASCAGIEVKPASEFGYQRGFNPAG